MRKIDFHLSSRIACLVGVSLAMVAGGHAVAQAPVDHSGVFKSEIGEISIMLGNGEAIVSYGAVFGATAHICDWVATGRAEGNGTYVFKADTDVITLRLSVGGASLEATEGLPTYCGAGWPGDCFGMPPDRRVEACTVKAGRAYFYGTDSPPARRRAFVVRGDQVFTLPCQHNEGDDFVLARFSGPKGATIGLLRRVDLSCPRSR
jgi:hypothetical protein